MKNRIINSIVLLLMGIVYSCSSSKPSVKEIISKKEIKLVQAYLQNDQKNLVLLIPIEFELDFNHKVLKDVGTYFYIDNERRLVQPLQSVIVNSKTDSIIFAIEDLNYKTYPRRIYFLDRTRVIHPDVAQKLVDKYNPSASVEDIKTRQDTITLVSYEKFRKDFPKFVKEMRKKPDSIIFSLGLSGGKSQLIKEEIKW